MSGQFYLFAGSQFYARGGAIDYRATFPTVQQAVGYVAANLHEESWDWWHVTNDSLQILEFGGCDGGYR